MRMIDKQRGRIFGINFIDLMVGVVILFLVFSFGSKILIKDLTFSGDEMYSAIQTYQKLDSKGFLLAAKIDGKWIADEEDFASSGILIRPRSGAFEFKDVGGERLWVGGSMSYLEDVAVDRMTFIPLDNYVAKYPQDPVEFASYQDMLSYFEAIKAEKGADHLMLSMDMAFVNPAKSAQEIFNDLDQLYYIRDVGKGQFRENEVIFKVELVEVGELAKLDIASEKVIVGSVEGVYLGYEDEPNLPGYHVASLEELK
jgi:hypothetical protein